MAQNSMSLLRANWLLCRPVLMKWAWACLMVWVPLQVERRERDGWFWRYLYGGSEEGRKWRGNEEEEEVIGIEGDENTVAIELVLVERDGLKSG